MSVVRLLNRGLNLYFIIGDEYAELMEEHNFKILPKKHAKYF